MKRQIGLLIVVALSLLAGARPQAAGIAFVNASANFVAGAGTSISTPATSLTTGNLEVCAIRLGTTVLSDVTGVTDTAGNLYRFINVVTSATASLDIWYSPNVTGNASNVVTAAFGSTSATSIVCEQFSGIATGSPFDVFSQVTSTTSTTPTAAALTTTVANEVLILAVQIENTGSTWTAGSGYTIPSGGQDASNVTVMEYQIVSTLQSAITPTITSSAGQSKCGEAATFNAPTSSASETSSVISGGS